MATPLEVIDGIETRLLTISGLRVSDIVTEDINPPYAIISPPDIDYNVSIGRSPTRMDINIILFVSRVVDRIGQKAILEYAAATGTKSIPTAIRADKTLGLAQTNANISAFRSLGLEEISTIKYYGGLFTVSVVTAGV